VQVATDFGVDGGVGELADGGRGQAGILNLARVVPAFVLGAAALRAGGTAEGGCPHMSFSTSDCLAALR
jgi:hypothetical protein